MIGLVLSCLISAPDPPYAWSSEALRRVSFQAPEITLTEPEEHKKWRVTVQLASKTADGNSTVLRFSLKLHAAWMELDGSETVRVTPVPVSDGVLYRSSLSLNKAAPFDLETVFPLDVSGPPVSAVGLPEHDGFFRTWPMSVPDGGAGRFELGNAARGPVGCSQLGMPVVGMIFPKDVSGGEPLQLAVATDPYCGSYVQAQTEGAASTHITVRTTYTGSVVPVKEESRTLALKFHRSGIDGTLQTFYLTIPEIEQGAAWTDGVQLVYYDYLSDRGKGWFDNLTALANRIPPIDRSKVAVCMHGWYDYFQQYAFDDRSKKLLESWTAFPGTYKVPMSIAEMHRRMRFAKELGFRVLLYFADGTNSDSGAPNFHSSYLLLDKNGARFPGWKGPDSVGQPYMMDPSVPGLRAWYRDYLKALLDEYANDVDGFVWDETFYIKPNFISDGSAGPQYADRAMMSLVSELTQLVQSYHKRNPDLVFLASDIGVTSYALVSNGTFQDSAMDPYLWGPSLFANYRNCLWSCNWYPVSKKDRNVLAADKYGFAQALSDGWEDDQGPAKMPKEILDEVIARFAKNVASGRQRLRYLLP